MQKACIHELFYVLVCAKITRLQCCLHCVRKSICTLMYARLLLSAGIKNSYQQMSPTLLRPILALPCQSYIKPIALCQFHRFLSAHILRANSFCTWRDPVTWTSAIQISEKLQLSWYITDYLQSIYLSQHLRQQFQKCRRQAVLSHAVQLLCSSIIVYFIAAISVLLTVSIMCNNLTTPLCQ